MRANEVEPIYGFHSGILLIKNDKLNKDISK